MQFHTISRFHKNRTRQRVGRGGKRGKTSGRGGKGQTARAGNKRRPEWRDIIKKLPKRRGYGKNRARTVDPTQVRAIPVSLSALEKSFKAGDTISPSSLLLAGIVGKKSGRIPPIKILGGELTKKLTISGCAVSKSAALLITKAGGTVS